MNKTDSIARRILGWKLNRWDRWYDYEKGVFIHDSEFQPEHSLDHAHSILRRKAITRLALITFEEQVVH